MSHPDPTRTYEEDAEYFRTKERMSNQERRSQFLRRLKKFNGRLQKDVDEFVKLAKNGWVDRREKGRI